MSTARPAVLVVDDHENARRYLRGLLVEEYEVVECATFDEAISLLGRQPPFHVAVLDLRLVDHDPENIDGQRILDQVMKWQTPTSVIVLTGYGTVSTTAEAFSCGAFFVFDKMPEGQSGFRYHAFLETVRRGVDAAEKRRSEPFVFVAMPFADPYTLLYQDVFRPAIEAAGLKCLRADEVNLPTRIMDDIRKAVAQAAWVLGDLSGKSPNVLYEVGMAHAMEKHVVLLTQCLADIPEPLQDNRMIVYESSLGGARALRERLDRFVEAAGKTGAGSRPIFARDIRLAPKRVCVNLLPDGKQAQQLDRELIRRTLSELGHECVTVKDMFSSGPRMEEVWRELQEARIVIADMTGADPAVLYLTGMAHGLRKKVILVGQTGTKLPFDLQDRAYLVYELAPYPQARESLFRLRAAVVRELDGTDQP